MTAAADFSQHTCCVALHYRTRLHAMQNHCTLLPKPLVMLRSSRSTRSAPFKNDDLVKVTKDVPSLPKFGRGYTGVVVSVNEDGTATVRFEVEELQYDTGGTRFMTKEIKFSWLEKVEPELLASSSSSSSRPAPTKKNKAAASEQPEAAKQARRGGKEPAAASDDTPRAGTTIESGGSSSRRSSVRPLRPRTSPSLIDPGVPS